MKNQIHRFDGLTWTALIFSVWYAVCCCFFCFINLDALKVSSALYKALTIIFRFSSGYNGQMIFIFWLPIVLFPAIGLIGAAARGNYPKNRRIAFAAFPVAAGLFNLIFVFAPAIALTYAWIPAMILLAGAAVDIIFGAKSEKI